MTRFDAVVIGAGPAGSAAALALAAQGRSVAIVERAAFPRRKVCGEFLSATSVALLGRLGVAERWAATAGPPVRRVGLFAGEACVAAPMPRAGRESFGRALGRDRLDALLLDAASEAGVRVFQPWQAVAVESQSGERTVRLAGAGGSEAALSAALIIAAHGSWEPGRLSTQPRREHAPGDHLGFKAHFKGASLAPDLMPLLLFPGGYGGMVWADGGRLSLSLCIRRDALEALRAARPGVGAGEAVEKHLRTSCRGVAEALKGAVGDGPWLAAGPIRPGLRPVFAEGIFRAGNLAGESHPIIAEGISMALQSAWLLAAALRGVDLRDARAQEEAGRRYRRAWRRQFASRIRAAALLAAAARAGPMRGLIAAAAARTPALLTLGAVLSGKTRALPGLDAPA